MNCSTCTLPLHTNSVKSGQIDCPTCRRRKRDADIRERDFGSFIAAQVIARMSTKVQSQAHTRASR